MQSGEVTEKAFHGGDSGPVPEGDAGRTKAEVGAEDPGAASLLPGGPAPEVGGNPARKLPSPGVCVLMPSPWREGSLFF